MVTNSNESSWTLLQVFTVALCFFLTFLDGADVVVVSLVAPVLIDSWQVSEAAFGIVFSSGLIGMTSGSLFLAPFADRLGRKPLLVISTVIIAASMLSSALASDLTQLTVLRFITGVGIGGILATCGTMASEFAPQKFVSAAVMTVMAGYPTGAMMAGLVANVLMPEFGWQSLFIVAGMCSAVLVPIIFFFAPESPDFLLARQKQGDLERANKVLAAQGREQLIAFPAKQTESARGFPLPSLFRPGIRTSTALFWISFIGAFFVVYFLLSWIPRMGTHSGYSLQTAINGSAIFNGGAIVGLLLVGWLTSRWNLGKVIAVLYGMATIMMMVFAKWSSPVAVYYGILFAIGFFQQSGNGAMYAAVTQVYSADMKTTGLGWAVGMGRLGAVLGPAAGGIALSAGMSISWMFVVFSLPMVATAACSYAIGVKHFSK